METTVRQSKALMRRIIWSGIMILLFGVLAGCGTSSTVSTTSSDQMASTTAHNAGTQDRSLAASTPDRGLGRVQPGVAGTGTGAQHALVIGNARYQHSPLRNPTHDAEDMAAVLRERGFTVTLHKDLNSAQLQEAVRQFGERLRTQRGTGVVFFAGHGVEVEGENFLIPVDNARILDDIDVRQYALSVNYLLARVQAANNPLNVVILDACRDNPFAGSTRSLHRGLGGGAAPSGTVIAYATAPGRTADDNPRGRNGLYTEHLMTAIRSGQRVEDVFQHVRRSVLQASGGRQEPWYNASLDGIYCIGGCAAPVMGADELAASLQQEREATARLEAALAAERDRVEQERLQAELAAQRQREQAEQERIEAQRRQEAAERERLAAELEAQRRERERLEAERQRLEAQRRQEVAEQERPVDTGSRPMPGIPAAIRELEANMVRIPGGSFQMGCVAGRDQNCFNGEKPPRRVTVPAFMLGKYEVTFAQWDEG